MGSLLQKIDFAKQGGLIPAIVQDAENGQVLMLAYMSAEKPEDHPGEEAGLLLFPQQERTVAQGRDERPLSACEGDRLGL